MKETPIPKYDGETKPRSRFTATLLTFLCPGLGYMYTGQLYKGISINFAFLIMIECFVIVFTVMKFFPLLPGLVVLAAWIIFTLFALKSVLDAASKKSKYVLKGFNHWVMYSLVFLFTFALPLYLTKHFVTEYAVDFETMQNDGMFPTLRVGDTVLIDRSSFLKKDPQLGELVWVQLKDGNRTILRVVGIGNDTLKMDRETVFVNEQHLLTQNLKTESALKEGMLAMVEENRGASYVISSSPEVFSNIQMPPVKIADDHLFLLSDNRSQIGKEKIQDSRDFGTISKSQILGKPMYIGWSKQNQILWERIGLAIK